MAKAAVNDWRVYVGNGQYCFKILDEAYERASLDGNHITRKELAHYYGIPVGTWKRWTFEGFGPKPIVYHGNHGREFGEYPALYHSDDVDRFLADPDSHQRVIGRNRKILLEQYNDSRLRKLYKEAEELRGLIRGLERKYHDRFNGHRRRSRQDAGAVEEARPRKDQSHRGARSHRVCANRA